ncbi:hypothetical protein L4D76_15120 [Photobacterium sagamiensis]|uniref:hypothetical protein n=1 Tax=Photobacterium sagamiensis TaxID=2910241 RepID=UPI003D0C9F62
MKLNKRKAQVLKSAIDTWEQEKSLTKDQADQLRQSYQVVGLDWKLLAVYSFWIAITCFIISIGVLLADDYLLDLLAKIVDAPAGVLSILSAAIAILLYAAGIRRRQKYPSKTISNEATFFFGVLITAVSVFFFGETTLYGSTHDALLLLLLTLIYGGLGLRLSSVLIWLFALFAFGCWVLAETSYLSDTGNYFLGMNHPLRFVFVGIGITALSLAFQHYQKQQHLQEPTRFVGLLYLFLSLWLLSVFGNFGDINAWSQIRQIELLHWSALAVVCCIVAIYIGIKFNDTLSRSFGITFLLINFYTRYFEYFWNSTHKTIFFALLALSFWGLGSHAEKLWRVGNTHSAGPK